MTRLPQPVTFAVTFKAVGGVSDASAVRQLRQCLKHAGRVCKLKCTRAVRVAGGETINEAMPGVVSGDQGQKRSDTYSKTRAIV